MNTVDYSGWKVTPNGHFCWDWTRPTTAADRAIYGLAEGDDRPMSLLGLSVDDSAVIADGVAARAAAAIPEAYAALQNAEKLLMEAIRRLERYECGGSRELCRDALGPISVVLFKLEGK